MLVTAIVKDNNLIIPNIDVSLFAGQPNEFGLIQLDLNYVNNPITLQNSAFNQKLSMDEILPKSTTQMDKSAICEQLNVNFDKDNQMIHPKVAEFGGILAKYTNKTLSVDEMNSGIAQHFASLNKDDL